MINKRINNKQQLKRIRKGPQLYVTREKFFNCKWKFITGDEDDHPSVPHAHAVEKGYRLNKLTLGFVI